jgi:hypothetical protein
MMFIMKCCMVPLYLVYEKVYGIIELYCVVDVGEYIYVD